MGLFKKETSNKVGRVKKCPQCGASVPASKVVCPECGWEFDESNSGGALDRLHNEIKKSEKFFSGRSESDVICAFPIPKTKADLLELTIFFKSKVKNFTIIKQNEDAEDQELLLAAYKQKYEECIMKAELFYASDLDFQPLITSYYQDKKALEDERKKKMIIYATIGIVLVATILVLIFTL